MKKLFSIFVITFCSLQSVPITLAPAAELLRRFDERLPELKTFMREWRICEEIGGQSVEPRCFILFFPYLALDFATGTNTYETVLGRADRSLEALACAIGDAVGGLVKGLVMEGDSANPRTMQRLYELRILLNNAATVLSIFGDTWQWPAQDARRFHQLCENILPSVEDVLSQVPILVEALHSNPGIRGVRDSIFVGEKNPFAV